MCNVCVAQLSDCGVFLDSVPNRLVFVRRSISKLANANIIAYWFVCYFVKSICIRFYVARVIYWMMDERNFSGLITILRKLRWDDSWLCWLRKHAQNRRVRLYRAVDCLSFDVAYSAPIVFGLKYYNFLFDVRLSDLHLWWSLMVFQIHLKIAVGYSCLL